MALKRQTEKEHFEELELSYRRNLQIIEEKIASYGGLRDTPLHLLTQKEEIEQALADVQRKHALLLTAPSIDTLPYLALNAFDEQHAHCFYGRETMVAQLVEMLDIQPFLAVLGPSGSGKSSIVRAGLIPTLKQGAIEGSAQWLYLMIRPGMRPLDAIATGLAALQGNVLAVTEYSKRLRESPQSLLLIAETLLLLQHSTHLMLVIDQFEELWTQAPTDAEKHKAFVAQEQQPFIDLLLDAVAAPGSLVMVTITMRADFLHRAAEHRELAQAISQRLVIVGPMTPDELQRAIEYPALQSNGNFEPGLVDELIEQVHGEPGCLPLLQFTLFELWKVAQTSNGRMTWQAYRDVGRVEGALARIANRILETHYTLPEAQHSLRNMLLRLVQPGDGAADTRRRALLVDIVPAQQTLQDVQTFLMPLIEARLLTTGQSGQGQATIELSHESLIRAWPTMKTWIDEARTDLRLQLQLEEAAKEWHANGEDTGLLWGQVRLNAIDVSYARAHPQLTLLDNSFLEASRSEQARIIHEREEQQRKEEQFIAEQRLARRLRYLRQVVGIALGAGLGYGLALTYLLAAIEAGPFLAGPRNLSLPVFILVFLALFLPGTFVGASIGFALWWWHHTLIQKRVATGGIGMLVGCICYALFVIFVTRIDLIVSGTSILKYSAGALLGLGLGMGAAFARCNDWRKFAIPMGSILTGIIGYLIGGFAPDIVSTIIASAMLGGLTGLGWYTVALE